MPAQDDLAVETILRFARAANEAGGYPANELEPRIVELAQALGLEAVQVTSQPAEMKLTVGYIPDQQVYVLRVRPRATDLHAIGRLDEIAAAIVSGRLDHQGALAEIEELGQQPLRRPVWLVVGAYGLAAAGLAPIVGGGWREALAAGLVGLSVGILSRIVKGSKRSAALAAPLGAFLASFLASAIAHAGLPIAVTVVTFAALVALLPGLAMAIGMRELATRHVQAGISNLANSLMQLVGLAFGVAVGNSVATSWLGATPVHAASPLHFGVDLVAAALVGLAFTVTLSAPARDAIWTCSAAVLAVVVNRVATELLGSLAGVFVAALVVGLAGNVLARRFHRSRLAFIVPGILMLVPGSIGYQSASSFFAGETVTGIDTAFDTFATLLAIAYGLVASAFIMPDQLATSGGQPQEGTA